MLRIFLPEIRLLENKIQINQEDKLHHLKDVLRVKEGEDLIIVTSGWEFLCLVSKIDKKEIICEIRSQKEFFAKFPFLSIACAIPKRNIFDELVDKLTQLGVEEIFPIITQRTSVRLSPFVLKKRLARWQRIAIQAAQQSGRKSLPKIAQAEEFLQLIPNLRNYDLKIIPTLLLPGRPIRQILPERKPERVIFAIGPEGDFTSKEIELAQEEGFIPVSLGDLVLRVEVAAVAVASFIHFYYAEPAG